MSLVTTSNLAKMNKDRFQKKTIEPAVYPPPQVDDGFKNPTLGNSFIQNQEPTIFKHPSINSNYGFGNILIKDTFGNIQLGGSHLQKMKPAGGINDTFSNSELGKSFIQSQAPTNFPHPSINNNYGFGNKNIQDTFTNPQLGNSFIQNEQKTNFNHPSINNNYGYGNKNIKDTFTNPQLGNSFIQNEQKTNFSHPSINNNYGFGNKNITDTFTNPQLGGSFVQNGQKTNFSHPSIKNNYGYGISVNGVPLGARDAFFPNPDLKNSFIQKGQRTVFNHPGIKNNYGFGVKTQGKSKASRDAFFTNPQQYNSFLQKGQRTIFDHPGIKNNYGFGVKTQGQSKASRDAFFKNPTKGNSFKQNHERTIFDHPTIRNDYGFGIPRGPILDFTIENPLSQHNFIQFIDNGVINQDSQLQPEIFVADNTSLGLQLNPDYRGPEEGSLTTWSINTPIQQISMNWTSEADFKNPSKKQEFLNNHYTQYTRDQIRSFSGARGQGDFIEPHIYTDITFFAGKEGANDGTGNTSIFKLKGNPIGADFQRYASHLRSTRGLLFIGKKFLQQSFNQRAENGIFNPIGVLLSRNNILRFKSQFEFDVSSLGEYNKDLLKTAGRDALDLIKGFAGADVNTYQDSQNAFIIDNEKSFLQSHGYGVNASLPTPLFNQGAEVIGNIAKGIGKAIADAFKTPSLPEGLPGTSESKEVTVVAPSLPEYDAKDQSFVVGKTPRGEGAVPSKNTEAQVSLAKYKALSYGGIVERRKGISGNPGETGTNGYFSLLTANNDKKTIKIDYGLDVKDEINAKKILNGDLGEKDIYTDVEDFIPFYINILNTDETIVLRANLTDLSEDITPNWEEIEYIGRPDKQYVYKNTDRKISFKVSIIPSNEAEFEIMWRKINKLTALNYPSLEDIDGGGQRMVAPFVKLTLGDMIRRQAGYFEQIKANPIDNTPYVLKKGKRLPMYMEVECSFVYIGNKIPQLAHENLFENSITNADGKLYDFNFNTETN